MPNNTKECSFFFNSFVFSASQFHKSTLLFYSEKGPVHSQSHSLALTSFSHVSFVTSIAPVTITLPFVSLRELDPNELKKPLDKCLENRAVQDADAAVQMQPDLGKPTLLVDDF